MQRKTSIAKFLALGAVQVFLTSAAMAIYQVPCPDMSQIKRDGNGVLSVAPTTPGGCKKELKWVADTDEAKEDTNFKDYVHVNTNAAIVYNSKATNYEVRCGYKNYAKNFRIVAVANSCK